MTESSSLLVEMRRLDIHVEVVDGNLKINAPKGALTADLQDKLRTNKQALIDFLESTHVDAESKELEIPVLPAEQRIPMSFAQERLWYIEQLVPGLTAYNVPLGFSVSGDLDLSILESAINLIVARHAALRTTFPVSEGVAYQKIADVLEIEVPIVDLSTEPASTDKLRQHIRQLEAQPFDLVAGPLMRAMVFGLPKQQQAQHYHLYFSFHHLIFDGVSINLFVTELLEIYNALFEQRSVQLADLSVQYGDYATWHRTWIAQSIEPKQLTYWKETLKDLPDPLPLPFDFTRPAEQSYTGDTVTVSLPDDSASSLDALGSSVNASMYMTLLGTLKILLYKYTACTDIVVGTFSSNRPAAAVENLIGYFANTLVARTQLDLEQSPRQTFAVVRDVCLGAYSHQELPFELLIPALNPERDPSRSPIFQVMFNYSDDRFTELESKNLQLQLANSAVTTARTDLAIDIARTQSGLEVVFEYATALFERDTIEQLANHFVSLTRLVSENPDTAIGQLQLLSAAELDAIDRYHQTYIRDYPQDQLLPALIAENVEQRKDKIAVSTSDDSISYLQLGELSDQFARYITEQGVSPGTWVGVCIDRTVYLPVVLLGLFKAGCTYVPLDPEFPVGRLQYMIEDSNLKFLVAESNHASRFTAEVKPLLLETFKEYIEHTEPATEVNTIADQTDSGITTSTPAQVIYTSGTTGKPKGVMVPHGAVANFLLGMAERPGLSAEDYLLAVTTLSFDISVLELFLPLVVGGTVVIASKEQASDGDSLLNLLKSHAISALQATPSTWRLLLASGWNAEFPIKILCGGEALPEDLAKQLLAVSPQMWNMYGPTETTVWSTCEEITPESGQISLGQPIANTRIYIMDQVGMLMPAGAAGELCIAGSGVTLGYHQRPDLTAERFVADPMFPSEVAYRTGDKARYRRDGSLEYLGRNDSQVKIRGYRIEPGDIESAINEHPMVAECAVDIRSRSASDNRLVAFIVWKDQAATLTDIRKFLRDRLPAYMIPHMLTELDALPRTLNGKIDRKGLPSGFSNLLASAEFEPPVTEVECWIAQSWCDIVGVEKVGLSDGFFDIGGHSLLSLKVIPAIEQRFGVKLPHRDILQETLKTIADKVSAQSVSANELSAEPVPATDPHAGNSTVKKGSSDIDRAESAVAQTEPIEHSGKEQQEKKGFFKRLFQ